MTESKDPKGSAMMKSQITAKEIINPEMLSCIWDNNFEDRFDKKFSIKHTKFLEILNNQIEINDSKHYIMPLSFKESDTLLPNNTILAEKRLVGLKSNITRDSDYRNEYVHFV